MIKATNITFKYGSKQILNNAEIEAKPGQIIAIVGRNGCGKSTFLKILSGILKPDSGSISYWDQNPLKKNKLFAKYIGYVPQENPLLEELSVADNLKFWAAGKRKLNSEIVQQFELSDILNSKVKDLSGGMKRRLAIACVFQRMNPCVILDEPTSSLDIYYQHNIEELLVEHSRKNGIIIMSTHNEAEIEMADVVYVLSEGKTIRIEKSDVVMNDIRNMFLVSDK